MKVKLFESVVGASHIENQIAEWNKDLNAEIINVDFKAAPAWDYYHGRENEICNKHYDCHWTEHDLECDGGELPEMNREDRFRYEKEQQGWPDYMDEEIWNEHFKH